MLVFNVRPNSVHSNREQAARRHPFERILNESMRLGAIAMLEDLNPHHKPVCFIRW
jgi:hypothetical protein